jgi:hypothetical protein
MTMKAEPDPDYHLGAEIEASVRVGLCTITMVGETIEKDPRSTGAGMVEMKVDIRNKTEP